MLIVSLLPIAIFVTLLLLGLPILIIAGIRIYSYVAGKIKVQAVRCPTGDAALGLMISWDNESHPLKVTRVRLEYTELYREGTSLTLSFTFEDKQAKRKSFILPMKIPTDQLKVLASIPSPTAARNSSIIVEVESLGGHSIRRRIPKEQIAKVLKGYVFKPEKEGVEMLSPVEPDKWSVLARVFPWKKVVEEAPAEKGAIGAPKAGKVSAPQVFDFIITKVWIEPGCIVCDACENEAPDVFQVLSDTCIVRPNAPLLNTGSIVAAADGCPVDVIKYDKAPAIKTA
jgi:ferredoxin